METEVTHVGVEKMNIKERRTKTKMDYEKFIVKSLSILFVLCLVFNFFQTAKATNNVQTNDIENIITPLKIGEWNKDTGGNIYAYKGAYPLEILFHLYNGLPISNVVCHYWYSEVIHEKTMAFIGGSVNDGDWRCYLPNMAEEYNVFFFYITYTNQVQNLESATYRCSLVDKYPITPMKIVLLSVGSWHQGDNMPINVFKNENPISINIELIGNAMDVYVRYNKPLFTYGLYYNAYKSWWHSIGDEMTLVQYNNFTSSIWTYDLHYTWEATTNESEIYFTVNGGFALGNGYYDESTAFSQSFNVYGAEQTIQNTSTETIIIISIVVAGVVIVLSRIIKPKKKYNYR